jgi:hypothetical protein
MQQHVRKGVVGLLVLGLVGMLICWELLTAMARPPSTHQAPGRARWAAQGLGSYRVTLRIEYRGEACMQQLEVRSGQSPLPLRNTCKLAWLNLLSVPELFDLAEQIEEIPPTRCYPSSRDCVCERFFSARQIEYDARMGYPALVLSRSELRPHWTGIDFWNHVLETATMPTCGASVRRLTVEVLALTAIDP